VRIIKDNLADPKVLALLQLHLEGMRATSPEESVHALDLDALRQPDVSFFTAWNDSELLGCGALKELDSTHGEVKSMRTDPSHFGKGVGASILRHLLNTAAGRGYTQVSLETGSGPAFEAAHVLYRRFGFSPCEPFGAYTEDPFSRFYTLELTNWTSVPAVRGSELIPKDRGTAALFAKAIQMGTAEEVLAIVEADPSLATGRFGDRSTSRSSLHIATDWPAHVPEVGAKIAALAAHGADPNAKFVGKHTETPLHWAASADDVEAIEALLAAGADLEAPGGVLTGGSPLDDAVVFSQWEAARLLVARGAQVKLFHAAALGLTDQVTDLMVDGDQGERDAAIWHAANAGHRDAALLLLNAGADPHWEGFDGLSPIAAARRSGHLDLAEELAGLAA
jgi:GNAT superfamily N-acetyltransferase